MKNRFLALLLALCLVLAFGGCGENNETREPSVPETEPGSVKPEGEVLVEDKNLTVKVTSIDEDDFWGYTLYFYIENKTDKTLTVSVDDVSVNGYMCDPFWTEDVSAGASVTSEVSFFSEDFETRGIETVTEILFTLTASDYENIFGDPILEKNCAIYPLGEDAVQYQVRQPQDTDIVLLDNASASMVVTGIDPNGTWGYTLKVHMENKTDRSVNFSVDNVSVNGYMCEPLWGVEVAAGMKAYSEISFMEDDLKTIGADTVTAIAFDASVTDAEDWSADPILEQACEIYPLGEDAAVFQERETQPGDVLLFDNEHAKMIVIGEDPDSLLGYGLQVYLENKTDKNVYISFEDVTVNGVACDPFWGTEIASGMRCISTVSWLESDFQDNGITEVQSVAGKVSVTDAENWFADPLVEETVQIEF